MVWHACSIYKKGKRERDEEGRMMQNMRDSYASESLDSDNFFEMEGKHLIAINKINLFILVNDIGSHS